MQLLGFILLASIVLAALRVAVVVLLIIYLLALCVSAIMKPVETFTVLMMFVVLATIDRHPLATGLITAAVIAVAIWRKCRERK